MGVCTSVHPGFQAFALPFYKNRQRSQPMPIGIYRTSAKYKCLDKPLHGRFPVAVSSCRAKGAKFEIQKITFGKRLSFLKASHCPTGPAGCCKEKCFFSKEQIFL